MSPWLPERQPVIVAARRSAIGRAGGMFAHLEVQDLAAPVLKAVVADAGIGTDDIGDVILGNAAGPGGNVARVAALRAGLEVEVAAMTTDRQCGSGLEAIMNACWQVAAGASDVILAGGVESTSRKPVRGLKNPKTGQIDYYDRARFAPEEIGDPEMGVAAENVARKGGISRVRQDEFALRSQQRAAAARDAGRYADEIVGIDGIARDECIREDMSLARLARLRPAFEKEGSVTVGNACPLNDGAGAVVVMTAAKARSLGHRDALAFVDGAAAGVDPNLLGLGPVASTQRLLKKRPDLSLGAMGWLEFNEAFAAQVLACLDPLDIEETLPNQEGGAIALGHPFGASGAILVTRLFSQMMRGETLQETQKPLGLAMIGIGGGQGLTAAFQRVLL